MYCLKSTSHAAQRWLLKVCEGLIFSFTFYMPNRGRGFTAYSFSFFCICQCESSKDAVTGCMYTYSYCNSQWYIFLCFEPHSVLLSCCITTQTLTRHKPFLQLHTIAAFCFYNKCFLYNTPCHIFVFVRWWNKNMIEWLLCSLPFFLHQTGVNGERL